MQEVAYIYDMAGRDLLSITPIYCERNAADDVAIELGRPRAIELVWQWATDGHVVIVQRAEFDRRSQTWSPMPTTSELNRAKAAKLLAQS